MLRELENGVPTGPVLNAPPKSVGSIGCPTEQMCVDSGLYCYCEFPEGYDPETQTLENCIYDAQTKICTYDAVDASAAKLDVLIAAKHAEITTAYKTADAAIFAGFGFGYTEEQQKKFWQRKDEAYGYDADPNYPTPYIDGIAKAYHDPVTEAAEFEAKRVELLTRAVPIAEAIMAATGANDGKYEKLIGALALVDRDGDYVTEKAKINAITW